MVVTYAEAVVGGGGVGSGGGSVVVAMRVGDSQSLPRRWEKSVAVLFWYTYMHMVSPFS